MKLNPFTKSDFWASLQNSIPLGREISEDLHILVFEEVQHDTLHAVFDLRMPISEKVEKSEPLKLFS